MLRGLSSYIDAAWCDEVVLDVKMERPRLLEFYGSLGFAKRHMSRNHCRDG